MVDGPRVSRERGATRGGPSGWSQLVPTGWLAVAVAAALTVVGPTSPASDGAQENETLAASAALPDASGTVAPLELVAPTPSGVGAGRGPVRAHEPTLPPIEQLSDLRRLPSRALGVPFHLTAVVNGVGGPWEPYFTRFDAANWTRVALWSDEARLWEPGPFADPVRHVFARRGSAAERRLRELAPYARIEIRGVVREVAAGEPWIEIWSVRDAGPGLTEAAVFHAARALRLEAQGPLPLARSELDKALAAPLPDHHRAALVEVAERLTADGGAGEGAAAPLR